MKIVRSRKEGLVAEGDHRAVIEERLRKKTRKGRLEFLRCRITAGRYEGWELDYLVPEYVKTSSALYAFLASTLGAPDAEEDVDAGLLVGKACVVEVKHVVSNGRTYANIVDISPPAEATAGRRTRKR